MNNFECERSFIEGIFRPVQRNVLIAEYCNSRFNFVNLVDTYYRKIDSNAIFMFLIICVTFPILFMAISAIAEKYLSVGMQDLSKRFHLSPSLAATTLIAFANGAPDVLASFSSGNKAGAAFISIGALFGAFIFNATLVIANIMMSISTDIVMPRLAVLKEIIFYSIAVTIILVFGFIKTSGYPFVITYLIVYAIYILATLQVDRIQEREAAQNKGIEGGDLEANSSKPLNDGDAKNDDLKVQEAGEDNDDAPKGKLGELTAELFDDEAGLYQNVVLLPLMASGLVTIPYLSNPLMKTHLKFLVLPISLTFTVKILELSEASLLSMFLVFLGISAVFLVLEMLNVGKYTLETVYEICSVFAAIAWIKIFSTLIIDFITFLAFYFSISEVVLSTLLLSAGNSLGDFFGNAALAMQGETVMAAMAAYSGQIFNIFVGLTMNVLVARLNDNEQFDIFGQDEIAKTGSMHPNNKFIIVVCCFVVFVLICNTLYYTSNKFVLRRKYGNILLAIYGAFFTVAIFFALFFRTDE